MATTPISTPRAMWISSFGSMTAFTVISNLCPMTKIRLQTGIQRRNLHTYRLQAGRAVGPSEGQYVRVFGRERWRQGNWLADARVATTQIGRDCRDAISALLQVPLRERLRVCGRHMLLQRCRRTNRELPEAALGELDDEASGLIEVAQNLRPGCSRTCAAGWSKMA